MMDICSKDKLGEAEQIVRGLHDLSQILAASKIPTTEDLFVIYEVAFNRVLELLQQVRAFDIKKIKSEEEIQ